MIHRILLRRSSFGIRRGEEIKEAGDCRPEAIHSSLGRLAQEHLELGEGVFDRIEVRRVGRQVEEARARGLDHLGCSPPLVAGQIVHDDDVALAQFGNKTLRFGSTGASGFMASICSRQ